MSCWRGGLRRLVRHQPKQVPERKGRHVRTKPLKAHSEMSTHQFTVPSDVPSRKIPASASGIDFERDLSRAVSATIG